MTKRPLDAGRKDALGRTVRVADAAGESRADAPAPGHDVSDRSMRDLLAEIGDDPDRLAETLGFSLEDRCGDVADRIRWGARVELWAYDDVPVPFGRDEFSEFDAFGDAWSAGVDDAMNWVQDKPAGDVDAGGGELSGVPVTAMFKMPDDFHRRVRDIDEAVAKFENTTGFTVVGFDADGGDGFDPMMVTVRDAAGVDHEIGYHHLDGLSVRDINGPHILDLFDDEAGVGMEQMSEVQSEAAGVAHMYGQAGVQFYNDVREHRS